MDKPEILVVEDNAVLQKVIELFSAKCGVVPHICGSGAQAVEAVKNGGSYALILMDWKLPDMDGLECTKLIREIQSQRNVLTPVIAMTASVLAGDKQKCLDAGMNDYMSKPFSSEQFKDMVFRWLTPAIERKAI
jgi:two-component system, sensor histidine kinase